MCKGVLVMLPFGRATEGREVRFLRNLRDIKKEYDLVLCDVWGVLHDGGHVCDGAQEAVRAFRDAHTRCPFILVSNSPAPGVELRDILQEKGIDSDFYDDVITAGDITQKELTTLARGKKCFFIGPDRHLGLFKPYLARGTSQSGEADLSSEALLSLMSTPHGADFAVVTGPWDEIQDMSYYEPMLQACLENNLTLVCANPDKTVVQGGVEKFCAGKIAESYENKGGRVVYCGKPYTPIYETAVEKAQSLRPQHGGVQSVLVIGDGPYTDIWGGHSHAYDTLFIAGGLERDRCLSDDQDVFEQNVQGVFCDLGYEPTYCLPYLGGVPVHSSS